MPEYPLHHSSHFTEASASFKQCLEKMKNEDTRGMRRPCWTGGYLYVVDDCLYGRWSNGAITVYNACDNHQYLQDDWEDVEHRH